jgi:hypothetical protein
MDFNKISKEVEGKLRIWFESQKGQTSGYEYERSYVEMMRQIERDIFQESLGKIPENRKKKAR